MRITSGNKCECSGAAQLGFAAVGSQRRRDGEGSLHSLLNNVKECHRMDEEKMA